MILGIKIIQAIITAVMAKIITAAAAVSLATLANGFISLVVKSIAASILAFKRTYFQNKT